MSKGKDYIPAGHEPFFKWQKNFKKSVAANASNWDIPPGKVAELSGKQSVYEPLYKAANTPSTRTAGAVAQHQSGRKVYEKYLRGFVRSYVAGNTAISLEEKKNMSLNTGENLNRKRTKITVAPDVHLKALGGLQILIQCRLPQSEGRPRLHHDADLLELRFKVSSVPPVGVAQNSFPLQPGDTAPTNYREAKEVMTSTKAKFIYTFEDPYVGGLWLYVFARYKNSSHDSKSGAWSEVAHVRIL